VLTVTHTDEACTGNASLSFVVSNTVPGSTIIYRIYKLPDLVNSIAITSANTFGGLAAGTYRVIATQTLGSDSGTQQQDVIISDTRNLVTFEVSGTATDCDSGTINVNVLTGVPVSYEIISGPVLMPPQASNSFNNLQAGIYDIRVNDACGEGVVQTFTLSFSNPPNLVITTQSPGCTLTSCDFINITYYAVADDNTTIRYPLNVQVIVYPPSGAPIVQNQILTSGPLGTASISSLIPFYYNQPYTYEIRITDACGNVYVKSGNQINLRISASIEDGYSNCLNGFIVSTCNYVPPYNITFLSAPSGFNPQTYNSNHPGPFSSISTSYLSASANEMPLGTYVVRITDACNHVATAEITLEEHEPNYALIRPQNICDDLFLQVPQFPPTGPLIATAVFTASTANLGSPIPYDVSGTIQSGVLIFPLPEGTHTIQGMDVCGNPYSYTIIIPPKTLSVIIHKFDAGCEAGSAGSASIVALEGSLFASVIITQAPAAFSQPVPYTAYSSTPPEGTPEVILNSLPPGNYVLQLTDTCGHVIFENITIGVSTSTGPLNFYQKRGCGESYDSIALESPNGRLVTVIITAAPPSFPFPLPYNVSFNIATNGIFSMNSFPEGTYTFFSRDICNVERTSTYTLSGYHSGGNIQVIDNCGSFAVDMHFSDTTTNQGATFWLQKYNPLTLQWTHPMTGVVYPNNTIPSTTNSYPLNNSAINNNIVAFGTFRIVTIFNYYLNGTAGLGVCLEVIKNFDFTGELKIISAYAIPCVNGGSQVFIVTNGANPLDYSITSKDGQPFLVENGTSNSFSNLQPGLYNFRVEDGCGNIVNRLLDITTLQQPEIASSNLCNGLNGQLSVQPFSFLNYEWWKDNDTANILSTTNVLTFNPYTAANAGVYHVRIYSTNTNSCVDRILTYTISPNAAPNAGLDGTRTICANSVTSINLFTVLNGSYDLGGTWQEATSSGVLIGSNWVPADLAAGIYIFRYTVNGFCNAVDDSLVTITISPAVDVPIIAVDTSFCPGEDLVFSIQSVLNAVYQWSGPNNFSSAEQNPTISNASAVNGGTYMVTATIGNCASDSVPVTVAVNAVPDFILDSKCEGGRYVVTVIPVDGSFDVTDVSYAWTGPNNYTNTINPIDITQMATGSYSVTVTNTSGCNASNSTNVDRTVCFIPNVITPNDDDTNESFDLTGFDVTKIEIYSRWGRKVYEKNNYLNEWHGQNMNGGILPDSTYYYIIKLGSDETKTGWIFLSRG
jgi:gliding motility-associated-like protein